MCIMWPAHLTWVPVIDNAVLCRVPLVSQSFSLRPVLTGGSFLLDSQLSPVAAAYASGQSELAAVLACCIS